MATFATFAETRALGAPIVRLFQVALGRDPSPASLAEFVGRLRAGTELAALARDLVGTDEFERLHGPGKAVDEAFVGRLCASVLGDQDDRHVRLLAALGGTRPELVAAIAESPQGRARIPLLPGLAPGAPPDDPVAYRFWVEEYDSPNPAALARLPAIAGPRVTVAMLAGDMTAEAALRTVESLRRQVYPDWELCLAARLLSPWPREALQRLAQEEGRVRLLDAEAGAPRAAVLGRALASGTGALACVLAPGDRLAPTALYEAVAALAAHPEALLLYTDEDALDGDARHSPRFKPAFSPDAMLAGDAIGQLALYRVGLLDQIGGLRPDAAPHEFYDLAFRAAAAAGPGRVHYLPAVLCHRASPTPDWPAPPASPRRDAPGLDSIASGAWPCPRFRLPDPAPLVSVIVPTRDRADLLAACAAGVLERTDYPALELLIVDNGSADPDAVALLAELDGTPRVRVLRRPEPFNFATLNNAAAADARGDVLVLLNSDTEVLHPDWLREMVSHAVRPGVGVVGARLLYPDGTLQHGGILLGPAGAATHVGRGAPRDAPGYLGQLACTRDLSAVTGACLAIRRETWRAVGGMDERLAVTWNDVDLCLRVRAAGLRVIWTPFATLLHREAVTRGLEAEDSGRQARFREEQALVAETWGDALERDPFLNPNLVATEAGPLALTRPRHKRPWEWAPVAASAEAVLQSRQRAGIALP
jgi:GT2 family glycosyltransferase